MGKQSRNEISDQGIAFIETAKKLGCDDDTETFQSKLRGVATAKAEPTPAKKAKPKKR